MNINKFEIDYSKFSDFNIDFSKVYVKSKRICSNNRNKYYQNWYLFTNGETYLALTVDGEITTTVDCRKAYVNRDIIALENFYNKCSFKEHIESLTMKGFVQRMPIWLKRNGLGKQRAQMSNMIIMLLHTLQPINGLTFQRQYEQKC